MLLIRRRRPAGEPVAATPSLRGSTYDGVAGAGRIIQALLDLGVSLAGPTQLVLDADASPADLDAIDLDRRFDVALLASHLVNVPDSVTRRAFLDLAARHLAAGGRLLVEHHPIDWAETAEPTRPTPGGSLGGSQLGMVDVQRRPPFVSAVSVYDVDGQLVRQPFTARVLLEAELGAELAVSGVAVRRRLNPTWLEGTKA